MTSGTTSTHFQRMLTRDFELRVVVTDNVSDTDEDTHYVSYDDGGGLPKLSGSGYEPIPTVYSLKQNYPNPFNPETNIRFGLPEDCKVKLEIFSIQGQVIATLVDGALPAGFHTARFDAKSYPSGIYFYKIVAGNFSDIKRMLLVK